LAGDSQYVIRKTCKSFTQYNNNMAGFQNGRVTTGIFSYILRVCLCYECIKKYKWILELRKLNGTQLN